MPYSPPESMPNRPEYSAGFQVEVDGIDFSRASFGVNLQYMAETNDGSLDDLFESLVAHIAEHPLVTLTNAGKGYPTSQMLVLDEVPTEEAPQ